MGSDPISMLITVGALTASLAALRYGRWVFVPAAVAVQLYFLFAAELALFLG